MDGLCNGKSELNREEVVKFIDILVDSAIIVNY